MSEETTATVETETTPSHSGASLLGGVGDAALAAAATDTPGATQQPTQPFRLNVYDGGQVTKEFIDSIPKEQRAVASFFQKYATAENPQEALIKGIAGLQYMAGQKGLEPLPDDAPENVRAEQKALLAKLNRAPEKPEGYELKRPEELPEGVHWPEGAEGKYAEIFHKHGASPELVKELWDAHMEGLQGGAEQSVQAIATYKKEQMDSLRSELGAGLEATLKKASAGADLLGIPKEMVTDATLVKALAKAADLVSEDRLVDGMTNKTSGKTYAEEASEQGRKSMEAASRGDHAAATRYAAEQSRLNKLHVEAQKRMQRN